MNTRLAVLSAVAALLGGYLVLQGLETWTPGGSDQAIVASSTAPRSAATKLNPLDGLDPEAFTDTIDKPLFNPSREPRPAEPVAPPPPAEPQVVQPPPPPPAPPGPGPDDYVLLGVSGGPDGRIAALRIASSGEVVYLRKGESVDNWSVVDIGDRSVAIGSQESPVTYTMFEKAEDDASDDGQAAPLPAGQAQPLPLPLPLPMPRQKQPPGQPGLPQQNMIPPNTGG